MSFYEIQFPDNISYGSSGGPGFSTTIVGIDSGAEQRVSRWSKARRKYDVSYGVKTYTDLQSILEFYMSVKGAAYGFRYKDWLDFTTASDGRSAYSHGDVALKTNTTGEDITDGSFSVQLKKRYQVSSLLVGGDTTVVVRELKKPVIGKVKIGKKHLGVLTEMSSGWDVSEETGIVTFTGTPPIEDDATIYGGCEFDVPVRFTEDVDSLLSISLESFDSGGTDSIELIEIVDHGEHLDEYFYGGADTIDMGGDITISATQGRVIVLKNLGAYWAALPDPWSLPTGGPHFYITNVSPSNVIVLKDVRGQDAGDGHSNSSSTALDHSLASGKSVTMWINEYDDGSRKWFVWESA